MLVIYDNAKLYEGNDHNIYDTDRDRQVDYIAPTEQDNVSFYDTLYNYLYPYVNRILGLGAYCQTDADCVDRDEDGNLMNGCSENNECSTESDSSCDQYTNEINKSKTCREIIGYNTNPDDGGGDNQWNYDQDGNVNMAGTDYRNRCAKCMKCKDGGMFPDSFYGYYCDGTVTCIDSPDDTANSIPYSYAYYSVDWDRSCQDITSGRAKLNCSIATSSLFSSYMMTKRFESIGCETDIIDHMYNPLSD